MTMTQRDRLAAVLHDIVHSDDWRGDDPDVEWPDALLARGVGMVDEAREEGRREANSHLCASCWHPDYHHSDSDRMCYVQVPSRLRTTKATNRCNCHGLKAQR